VTIADVFGAMITWCSHRPAMSCKAAYEALIEMGPKLDQQLVREFLSVARSGQQL